MALQTSGQISLSNIAGEKSVSLSNVSLLSLSTTSINTDGCNPTNPNNGAPHSIGEFYGYDHNCVTAPSTFEISMSGSYRDGEEACGDQGRSVERFVMYSNCSPDAVGVGCIIYSDSAGNGLWPIDGWYFHELSNTSYFISRGEVIDRIPCYK